MNPLLDRATADHFYAWLDQWPTDLQHETEQRVFAFLHDADDRHYWLAKGWQTINETARSMGYGVQS